MNMIKKTYKLIFSILLVIGFVVLVGTGMFHDVIKWMAGKIIELLNFKVKNMGFLPKGTNRKLP